MSLYKPPESILTLRESIYTRFDFYPRYNAL